MRIDGQTKPAPHHYIEALMKKIKYPNIELVFNITRVHRKHDAIHIFIRLDFMNWSPLQNEQDFSFKIITDGLFTPPQHPTGPNYYHMQDHSYEPPKKSIIMYYGESIGEDIMIKFKMSLTGETNIKSRIHITFGGKYSPRKSSHYELDISKYEHQDPNSIIILKYENKLIKDFHDEKGITKASLIKDILAVKRD